MTVSLGLAIALPALLLEHPDFIPLNVFNEGHFDLGVLNIRSSKAGILLINDCKYRRVLDGAADFLLADIINLDRLAFDRFVLLSENFY